MTFQERMELWLNNITESNLIPTILVLIVGYLVAKLLQRLTRNLLRRTDLDNRIAASTGQSGAGMSPERGLSKLVYLIVMLFVALAALNLLGLGGVLEPVRDMGAQFLNAIPRLIAAGIIGFVGYIIAQVVAGLVGMGGSFIQGVSSRAGLNPDFDLAGILRTLVFILVFIPFLVAALDAIGLDAITDPVRNMLAEFLAAIPNIVAAAVIIGAFYIGGRFVTGLLKDLLRGMNINSFANRLGIGNIIGAQTDLANLAGEIAFFFIFFLGLITGVEQLGFVSFTIMLTDIFELAGRVAFGLLILVIGNYLANLAFAAVARGNTDTVLAKIARAVVLGLFAAIALRTMGVADEIVNLAFGLTLGALAVAFALSFGLGGREAAGQAMHRFLNRFK